MPLSTVMLPELEKTAYPSSPSRGEPGESLNLMNPLVEQQKCVMIIAGETSGDHHGAKLVRAIRAKNKNIFFCGIGGQALKDAGARIVVDISKIASIGITEVISKIPALFMAFTIAKRLIKTLRPDLIILIDYPEFNFKIAAVSKKFKIPVLYYISPQIWAWRSGRIKMIKKLVDHMAVIFPFEKDYYSRRNVPVTFVGHPLLDDNLIQKTPGLIKCAGPSNTELSKNGCIVIGLLPGSRYSELARHLPVMINAAELLKKRLEKVKFIISIAPSVEKEYVKAAIKRQSATVDFELETGCVDKVFERSDFVVTASGTVTLQAAIAGIPMVIIYKVSGLSYWLGRALIQVKNVGIVNLIAGKSIVPELLQSKASAENIADEVSKMLSNPLRLENLKNELVGLRDMLGGEGASESVAQIAINMLGH